MYIKPKKREKYNCLFSLRSLVVSCLVCISYMYHQGKVAGLRPADVFVEGIVPRFPVL